MVALEEAIGAGSHDVEFKDLEHLSFYLKDLSLVVSFISDVLEVTNFWSIDLFVLRSNKHGCYPNELKLRPRYLFSLKVPVNEIDGDVKCFWD